MPLSRLTLKDLPSLTILAQNSENSEVQNLLDPEFDSGAPGGPPQPTPDNQPAAGGQMEAQPEGGGENVRLRPGRGQVAQGGRRPGSVRRAFCYFVGVLLVAWVRAGPGLN